jgi:flagellar hook-length control protein FliK
VLRQAAVEAPAPEAKAAPGQAAPAGASPAGPIVVSPGASFEAKLQMADAAGSTPSAPQARPAAAPPPAAQVAVHIARTFEEGVRRLEIKLSPAELGRVEVKLDVGHDGRVQAVVAADRQDTLDLLQRDARTLERALQDAGIRADSGSLSFTLRQQDQQAWPGSGRDGSRPGDGGRESASQADGLASVRPRPNLRALDISV